MVKKILLLGLLATGLYANEMETVDVKVCVDTKKHADKSFNQMKEMLVSMAQDEGYNSIYKKVLGEENKNALTDHHRKDLSVKVNDMLDEGNNFCNNSTISIKKDRLQYYLPQKVSKDRICHKDGNLSPAKLKEAAALKGYKALIAEITDKEISDEFAKKLVHNYQRDDGKMYMAQGAYCFGASGEVVPFEVDMGTVSQAAQTGNTIIKIIKNKGYAKVYTSNGLSFDFNVDFNGNGFSFDTKDYKKMQSLIENKLAIQGAITTRLMIPDDIKTNTVDVSLKGETHGRYGGNHYGQFNTYINGVQNKSMLSGVNVQHSNGIRYIELTIDFYGSRQHEFARVVKALANISYSIEGTKLNTFIVDKSNIQKAQTQLYANNGASYNFNVNFNGNGFSFDTKDYKKMQSLIANKLAIKGAITTRLMIPDDIKTNTVDVSLKGETHGRYGGNHYGQFNTYINGVQNKSMLSGVNVQYSNGIRYIELTIDFYGSRQHEFAHVVKALANISYSATDTENGEKWFALNNLFTTDSIKTQLNFNGGKATVDFNGNGFSFNTKDYKKMQNLISSGEKVNGEITTRLMIPDDIKTNTVNVSLKGETHGRYGGNHYGQFNTYINGVQNKSMLSGVNVKQDSDMKYIELKIDFYGSRQHEFASVVNALANISYSATDTENGEKWFALMPTK